MYSLALNIDSIKQMSVVRSVLKEKVDEEKMIDEVSLLIALIGDHNYFFCFRMIIVLHKWSWS